MIGGFILLMCVCVCNSLGRLQDRVRAKAKAKGEAVDVVVPPGVASMARAWRRFPKGCVGEVVRSKWTKTPIYDENADIYSLRYGWTVEVLADGLGQQCFPAALFESVARRVALKGVVPPFRPGARVCAAKGKTKQLEKPKGQCLALVDCYV